MRRQIDFVSSYVSIGNLVAKLAWNLVEAAVPAEEILAVLGSHHDAARQYDVFVQPLIQEGNAASCAKRAAVNPELGMQLTQPTATS